MNKITPVFEKIKKINKYQQEYWSARELVKVLDYSGYRNFKKVIKSSQVSCENSGESTLNHFVEVNNMVARSEELEMLQETVEPENNDLYDVLAYYLFESIPISRENRAKKCYESILHSLEDNQKEFIHFVLDQYVNKGFSELSESKLPKLIELKYDSVIDAQRVLGDVSKIRKVFFDLQKELYL